MNDESQSIISGKSQVKYGAAIQVAASYLKGSKRTSEVVEDYQCFKRQETSVILTNHKPNLRIYGLIKPQLQLSQTRFAIELIEVGNLKT